MIDLWNTLFLKAWNEELSQAEILEYNFLVSVLGISDRFYAYNKFLYYPMLRKFIPLYKEEGYTSSFSVARVGKPYLLPVWKCADFLGNDVLVE